MSKKQKPNIVSVTLHDKGIGCYRVTFDKNVRCKTSVDSVDITKGSGYYFVGMDDELATFNKATELIKKGSIR